MINFREIPEVKERLEINQRQVFDQLLPAMGQKILLEVEVTDPYLMQIVLISVVTEKSPLGVPGAKILVGHFDGDKSIIRSWLEKRIVEIDNGSGV